MPALYVLDCPEFHPLVEAAQGNGDVVVTPVGHHIALESTGGELRIRRSHTGLIDAIWYAALTGGIRGRIVRFDAEEICVA